MGEVIRLRRERKYLQYNDLVFDGYDMLGEYDDPSVSFKVTTHDLSFGHGSYVPFKRPHSFAEQSSVSLTLWLKEKKLPCDQRDFYRSFVVQQLMQHGRLWAVQDNTIVWAYATVTNYSEPIEHLNGKLGIDVDFMLYEGIWHKADKQKTFMVPWDICTFMECYDFKKYQPCSDAETYNECCDCLVEVPHPENDRYCCNCDCDHLEKYMALCYHVDELQTFYSYCTDAAYRFVYDCDAAERFFDVIGQKICMYNCNNGVIAGKIYSETDIPTETIGIVLVGKMHNPYIEINGNGNYISGDFDGTLVIKPSGDVYYVNGNETLEPDAWVIPSGMDYGWRIQPRNNRVIVNMGACCGKACAYFDIDNITI